VPPRVEGVPGTGVRESGAEAEGPGVGELEEAGAATAGRRGPPLRGAGGAIVVVSQDGGRYQKEPKGDGLAALALDCMSRCLQKEMTRNSGKGQNAIVTLMAALQS
jgi:hypothetical protein